jgi:hypothetical protein
MARAGPEIEITAHAVEPRLQIRQIRREQHEASAGEDQLAIGGQVERAADQEGRRPQRGLQQEGPGLEPAHGIRRRQRLRPGALQRPRASGEVADDETELARATVADARLVAELAARGVEAVETGRDRRDAARMLVEGHVGLVVRRGRDRPGQPLRKRQKRAMEHRGVARAGTEIRESRDVIRP